MANVKNGNLLAANADKQNAVKTKQATMQGLILSMEKEIKKALPSVLTPERFTRMVLTALSTTPALMECTPKSFLGAGYAGCPTWCGTEYTFGSSLSYSI